MKSVTSFHRGISFTISVSGPSAGVLAFKHLPTQLPLAVLLSLLIGYIAAGDGQQNELFWEINLALAEREFELFCQPLLNARTQQCTGVEILLRWNNPRQAGSHRMFLFLSPRSIT